MLKLHRELPPPPVRALSAGAPAPSASLAIPARRFSNPPVLAPRAPELGSDAPAPIELLTAPNLRVTHGFSTRAGGVSDGPYDGLNLGLSTGDDPTHVAENRRRFAAAFGADPAAIAGTTLVHGARVAVARAGAWDIEADGAVSNDPNLLLVVGAADCFPLLFHAPDVAAVGVAHCGWRGTAAGVAGEVVRELAARYGADPAKIQVAIGPGIRKEDFTASAECIETFRAHDFPDSIFSTGKDGKTRIDLVAANRAILDRAGIDPDNIHDTHLSTTRDPARFYSNRRDGRITGRMWAGIRAPKVDLVDARSLDPRFIIDVRYATADNFTGTVLYPHARCLVRAEVGEMLKRAQAWIDANHPGFVLMLKDGYRPISVQKKMWSVVEGTPGENYVANPYGKIGSIHSYGAAVDLTLAGSDGRELDMGTEYDHLGPRAEPRHEDALLAKGELTREQVTNRRILREAMTRAGFIAIPNEWWHFDAKRGADLQRTYQPLDVPLDFLDRLDRPDRLQEPK